GDVEHGHRVDAGADAELLADGGEGLGRGVARPGPEPPGAAVHLGSPGADGADGVGHPEGQVLVAVEPDGGVVPELGPERLDPLGDLLQDEGARGVGDVDTLAAGVGHDPGLGRQDVGRLGVGHHQEADRLQPDLPGQAEVLDGDVGLGAVGGDADHRGPQVGDGPDVVADPEAGEHQAGDLGPLGPGHRFGDQLPLADGRLAVVERRPAEAVAVTDLDDGDPGGVEGGDDGADLVPGELVPDVVRPVPTGGVGD